MPTSVQDRVCQAVLDRLALIDATGGDYANTINVVEENPQKPYRTGDLLAEMSVGDPEPQQGGANMTTAWNLPADVTVFIHENADSDMSVRERLGSAAADVRKALMTDEHFGDLVIQILWDRPDQMNMRAAPPSVIVRPTFQFRHRRGDPYTLA
jgi:hypothetical protein